MTHSLELTFYVLSFYANVEKIMIICYTVPKIRCVTSHDVQFVKYGARRTDGRTEGKSDIKKWVPHERATTFFVKYFSLQLSSVTYFYNKNEVLIHNIYYNNY